MATHTATSPVAKTLLPVPKGTEQRWGCQCEGNPVLPSFLPWEKTPHLGESRLYCLCGQSPSPSNCRVLIVSQSPASGSCRALIKQGQQ